jgi:hypothetical protein
VNSEPTGQPVLCTHSSLGINCGISGNQNATETFKIQKGSTQCLSFHTDITYALNMPGLHHVGALQSPEYTLHFGHFITKGQSKRQFWK